MNNREEKPERIEWATYDSNDNDCNYYSDDSGVKIFGSRVAIPPPLSFALSPLLNETEKNVSLRRTSVRFSICRAVPEHVARDWRVGVAIGHFRRR